jgi:hypothetical protein
MVPIAHQGFIQGLGTPSLLRHKINNSQQFGSFQEEEHSVRNIPPLKLPNYGLCTNIKKDIFISSPKRIFVPQVPSLHSWALAQPSMSSALLVLRTFSWGWPQDILVVFDGKDHLSTLSGGGCFSSKDGLGCLCHFRSFPLPLPFLRWCFLGRIPNESCNHPLSTSC